jgi:predicted small lipoprotein YifL
MSGTTRVLAFILVVLMLAACGKKGEPQAPKDRPSTYPQNYPKE